ncbi:hypothetical protein [Oceanospirillum maris]|uniref:hypothetical protein n=1 Tax=Oceanospirillum maris TaxID=64977 RepID=UPI001B7FD7AA|nr:hypothetical protein [Oceanospirillum maris]
MTRTPPRFPEPATDHRTFRHPPLPGIGSPISGLAANQEKKTLRSSSVQIFLASATAWLAFLIAHISNSPVFV